MARFNSPLDRMRIAAPCSADWDQMIGNDRARFCGQCSLNVYNLSSMTRDEAESFTARNEGRLCVRFYRRADGSILTDNCPVGLRAIRRRMSSFAKAISSAVLSFFAGLGAYEAFQIAADFKPEPLMGEFVTREPNAPPAAVAFFGHARPDEPEIVVGRMVVIHHPPPTGRKAKHRTSKLKTGSHK